jgi:hypothetical protein
LSGLGSLSSTTKNTGEQAALAYVLCSCSFPRVGLDAGRYAPGRGREMTSSGTSGITVQVSSCQTRPMAPNGSSATLGPAYFQGRASALAWLVGFSLLAPRSVAPSLFDFIPECSECSECFPLPRPGFLSSQSSRSVSLFLPSSPPASLLYQQRHRPLLTTPDFRFETYTYSNNRINAVTSFHVSPSPADQDTRTTHPR